MNIVIIDHHLDPDAGVYRLTVGTQTEHLVGVFSEEREPVMLPQQPVLDDEGEPAEDADGNPILQAPEQMTEMRIEYTPLEDFVFAADDERWEGKDSDQIALEQRQLVKKALDDREAQALEEERKRASRELMPGVGGTL